MERGVLCASAPRCIYNAGIIVIGFAISTVVERNITRRKEKNGGTGGKAE